LKNIKTKLDAIQQKQTNLEEKINEENDFKLNIKSNKIKQSGRILNKASEVTQIKQNFFN
jgi:predicted HTH domain antitoxin